MKTVFAVGILALGVISLTAFNIVMFDVELNVSVIDREGQPVPGAEVGAYFTHFYGVNQGAKGESKTVITDETGTANLRSKTTGFVGGKVQKQGFYDSFYEEVNFAKMNHQGEELKAARQVILKEVRKPIPMIARKLESVEIPVMNEPCGYDFEIGDWVAPHGAGNTTDIIFNLTGTYPSPNQFDAVLEVTFPNEGDGLVPFDGKFKVGSRLRSDYLAPENGYLPKLALGKKAEPGQTNAEWQIESQPGENYYFRVRTVLDAKGKVVRANYGKIYGKIEYGRYFRAEKPYITAEAYYFNPQVNDRNVEFDPDNNLAEIEESFMQVSNP